MKKLALLLLILISSIGAIAEEVSPVKKVFISQVIVDEDINDTVRGIIAGLEKNGFSRRINLELRIVSARANPMLASQIAVEFMSQDPDVVVGVGTMPAQTFVNYAQANQVKLVFSSVTDPVSAKLLQDVNRPSANISGTSDFIDPELRVALIKKIQPNLKKLGVLYNPQESNSLIIVSRLEQVCPKFGVSLIKQTAASTSEVAPAAMNLAPRVEAILVDNDNTALAEAHSVVWATNNAKIPLYVSGLDSVKAGAMVGLGADQYEVGLQTAEIIAKALNGESLSTTKVGYPTQTKLYLNLGVAKALGISIPKDIIAQASEIFGSSK